MNEYEDHEEKTGMFDRELLVRLLYLSVQFGLIWGTIRFIMVGNPIAGMTCFLGFLGLGVLIIAKFALNFLHRISVMIELVARRSFLEEEVGRPSASQLDRLLRCDCPDCQEIRDRFGLPDRIDGSSLLTDKEQQEERN